MKYQLGQLDMINSIIHNLDNGITLTDLTEQLQKRQGDLYDYCKLYEEEEFQEKLNGVTQVA